MTLRELLEKEKGKNCYFAGNATEQIKGGKGKYTIRGEVWVIPSEILDMEVRGEKVKTI